MVAAKQVVDFPLNGRNFTQLLSLSPGVVAGQRLAEFGRLRQRRHRHAFFFPAINGQTNRSNFFMTDGLNNQGAFSSTYAVPPIIDSIGEFKVNGHNDLAEFRRRSRRHYQRCDEIRHQRIARNGLGISAQRRLQRPQHVPAHRDRIPPESVRRIRAAVPLLCRSSTTARTRRSSSALTKDTDIRAQPTLFSTCLPMRN